MIDRTRMTRMGRVVADLAAALLIAGIVSACSDQPTALPPAPQVTVESGVTPLTPVAPGPDESGATSLNAPSSRPIGADIFGVGDEVQARGRLRIFAAAATDGSALAEYAAGDRFTVLNAPGNIAAYPIELNGMRWYRVRAEDGLVGWVMADGIEEATRP